MDKKDELPKTEAEALARGFKKIDDIQKFIKEHLRITSDDFKQHRETFARDAQFVDCTHAPPNTRCFERCYPDGTLVFGLCGANKSCVYFQGTCPPH